MYGPGAPATDPLRIVFLDSWKPASHEGSGTAVGIANLKEGLELLGHRVELLRPERSTGTLLGRTIFNLRLPRQLESTPSPDLVVGFDLDGFTWGASSLRKSPYVVALKGVAIDEARFSRSPAERCLLGLLALAEARNARNADAVLVPSRYSSRVAQRAYDLPPGVMRVVPEAVDLRHWDELRTAPPPPPEHPTILSVAHQYPRKDTASLLRALPLVRRAIPAVRLEIIGGGPELPRLRALAGALRLDDRVTFHGSIPEDQDVRRAYFAAHVFCLPSRQEGFGIVFVEAMAAGLPVVAARAGAVPEVVAEGETGLLVPPQTPRALAEALIRILSEPETRKRMGAAGVLRARTFDLVPTARRFVETVAPFLSSRPTSSPQVTPSRAAP